MQERVRDQGDCGGRIHFKSHTAKKDKSASQREKRNTLSVRHISATVLKTTLEKLTVSRMVFMLGSCTSRGLCWGV